MLNPANEFTDKEKPVMINEPTCGSGTMIIGATMILTRLDVQVLNDTTMIVLK